MQTTRDKRAISGVILLDKPRDITSNSALQKVKRLFQAVKAGHTGTLDPLATGLLPICLGEATKFSQSLLDAAKAYRAVVKLGQTTTTGDAEGEITSTRNVAVSRPQVEAALERFIGSTRQTPPMHSALKHQGQPLYVLARQRKSVERSPRQIQIASLHLEAFAADALTITVCCSKGTYIRVLAEDIGGVLGCGAYLQALRRLGVGPFSLEQSVTLAQLEAMSLEERDARLLPVDALLYGLPEICLDELSSGCFLRGQEVAKDDLPVAGLARIYDIRQRFIGVGEITQEGRVRPKRVLASGALK
ncbi:MAG TPA: tRNA pseudouridine(55) synthase TruB [Burkholderiales bacterium]|nr:tRNA pseudouridine(55) synthase TruB [Burkholderiales bacterium]